ncbi:MAG: cytochrome P450 [Chloroflexi bacterium]|nr:cytochrome P450 [Chloroflexota bacterium]
MSDARDWDPLDPETFRDVTETYRKMRERCPIAHSDRWGGFWALTRHADITRVASDNETFISSIQNLVPMSPRSGVPRRPLQVDPPEHAHFRRAMNPYFETERVAVLEPTLRQLAARYLESLITKGRGDAMDEYARCLPIRAICAFLRTPEEDADWIQARSSKYVEAISKDDRATASALSGELDQYARRFVANRRTAPLDPHLDIVSGMFQATIDGKPIADEIIAGFVRGLIVAADRSTSNGIGSSILHLAQDQNLQNYLRQNPSRLPDAIEEFVRLYAPSHATARTATREIEIGGKTIHAGEVVAMVFLAGNRDSQIFDRPDEFDLNRNPNPHLGFGHGVHKCAGQSLARLQLRIALEEFLARTSSFELDGTIVFNTWPEYGPQALPIRFPS